MRSKKLNEHISSRELIISNKDRILSLELEIGQMKASYFYSEILGSSY